MTREQIIKKYKLDKLTTTVTRELCTGNGEELIEQVREFAKNEKCKLKDIAVYREWDYGEDSGELCLKIKRPLTKKEIDLQVEHYQQQEERFEENKKKIEEREKKEYLRLKRKFEKK